MKNERIVKSVFSLTLSALFVKVIGVLYKVPLSYILSDVGMGYFNTAYSIYCVFYVLSSAGVPKAITCIISENAIKEDKSDYLIYRHSLKLFSCIGLIICFIYTIFSPLLVKILSNEKALYTVLLIGPSILFVATGGVCKGYLSAKGRLLPIAVSQALEAVIKLLFGVLLAAFGVKLGLDLKYVSALAVLGITIGSGISTLYLIISDKKHNKREKTGQKAVVDKRKINREIVKIALPITFGSSIITFANVIDVGLIMHYLTSVGFTNAQANELYGNYSTLAVPMVNLLLSLVTPLTVALLPRLVDFKVKNSMHDFACEVEKTAILTSFFICPCVAVYHFYSFDVLDILFSSSQSAKGYELLAILSLGTVFLSLLNIINTAHEALGNLKITVISTVIAVVTKIALSPLFFNLGGIGLKAIPLCTSLSNLTAYIFSFCALHRCGLKISFAKTVLMPLLLSLICFGIPYFFLYKTGILAGGFLLFCIINATSFVLYALFSFPFISKLYKKSNF